MSLGKDIVFKNPRLENKLDRWRKNVNLRVGNKFQES